MSTGYSLDSPRLKVPISERDHMQGPPNASLTLVEYGDYQCPFCGAAHPSVKQVQRLIHDLLFVFRHFPLSQMHPYALQAAEAAEAAGAQGRFWEMHDLLFANQDRLDTPDLLAYAQALGLDLERFAEELASHVHAPKVREDFLGGVRSGVNGTPTFFVNGIRHNGGFDPQSLVVALEATAAHATA
jgi:protein-disulfide isomerase